VVPGSQVPGLPSPPEQQPLGQLSAVQMQNSPFALQTVLGGQVLSHSPPQPSGPQTLPAQLRAQHVPLARSQTQLRRSGQSSSSLHRPVHTMGTQAPFSHCSSAVQRAHVSPSAPQNWLVFPGWQVLPASQQPFGQLAALQTQTPLAPSHVVPGGQAPQVPPAPQPSGPQPLPAQLGAQQIHSGLHSVAPGLQQLPWQQCVAQSPFGSGPSAIGV
jgi:hypothetical protein